MQVIWARPRTRLGAVFAPPERTVLAGRCASAPEGALAPVVRPATFWSAGDALAWLAGLVLMLSSLMGWYTVEIDGIPFAVIGWQTGALGKLVFFAGLAALVFLLMHATGFELPPALPAGVVVAGLGVIGTIFALIRVLEIPDRLTPAGRGVGLWVSLAGGVLLILAGLLKTAREG